MSEDEKREAKGADGVGNDAKTASSSERVAPEATDQTAVISRAAKDQTCEETSLGESASGGDSPAVERDADISGAAATASPIDDRIAPGVGAQAAGEGAQASSPASRRRTVRIAGIVAACAVVLVAALAGVGYATGLFGGADSASTLPAEAGPHDAAVIDSGSDSAEGAASDLPDEGSPADDADAEGLQTETDPVLAEGDVSSVDDSASVDASAGSSPAASDSGSSDAASPAVSTPAPAPQPEPAPAPEPEPQPATITVSVSIDSSRAASAGYPASMGGGSVTLPAGSSVYDALAALGVSIGGSSSYVSSINGLAEFAVGNKSGWMYSVNGSFPGVGCGSYILSGGENVVWAYTTDLGNDL